MTESQTPSRETSVDPSAFIPPSVHRDALISGASFTHFSPLPARIASSSAAPSDGTLPTADPHDEEFILGVDEAGRGPVLGPMVYAVFYLPKTLSDPLLRETHHFDDSKVLTPSFRAELMYTICRPDTTPDSLHHACGWATKALSARDISAGTLRADATYNLNAQAFDATVELIRGVLARGVKVTEIYVDTVGPPVTYQAKLQRLFPNAKVTVAKKADSLYPCVSAASVCAKVTRDVALEVAWAAHVAATTTTTGSEGGEADAAAQGHAAMGWGSGYPSDARCSTWLKANMHPIFGWGPQCRQSWSTAKDMLEAKSTVKVDWPMDDDGETARVTDYFGASTNEDADELATWYGTPAGLEAF